MHGRSRYNTTQINFAQAKYSENKNINSGYKQKEYQNDIKLELEKKLSSNFKDGDIQRVCNIMMNYLNRYDISPDDSYVPDTTDIESMKNIINERDISEYIEWCTYRKLSVQTVAGYKSELKRLGRIFPKPLRELTTDEIKSYLAYRLLSGEVKASTVDGQRITLNSFYTYMEAAEKIANNPVFPISKIKYMHEERIPLTYMEMEQIRLICNTGLERALFEFIYSTGGRVSEISSFNIEDLDFQNNTAYIKHGKGDKARTVVMSTCAVLHLGIYLQNRTDKDPALFVNSRGTRLSKITIEKIIHDLGVRAGINRDVFPHLLRHTMATHALGSKVPLDEVSLLLGHADIDTTQIYAKRALTEIKSMFKKISCK